MGKKHSRRFYRRVLLAVAVAASVIAVICIACSMLCIAHGRLWAILPLAIGIGILWLAEELGEAAEKRMG